MRLAVIFRRSYPSIKAATFLLVVLLCVLLVPPSYSGGQEVSLVYAFNDPGEYVYDSDLIEFSGDSFTVSPNSRYTVVVKDQLGEGDDPAHDFSAMVESTNEVGIIAERPMYFNYKSYEPGYSWTGGHDVMGLQGIL